MTRHCLALFLLCAAALAPAQTQAGRYDSSYMTMNILPGWTVAPAQDTNPGIDCCSVSIVHGPYVLTINPVFLHASGMEGGRVSEIVGGLPSVKAVLGDEDDLGDFFACMLTPAPETPINQAIILGNLYTDPAKAGHGCHLPSTPQPVWFGSYFGGEGPECDYSISLSYDSTDADALPLRNSPELQDVQSEVVAMLRTLHLKPPIVVSRIVPSSAPPGVTVTIYGSGFNLFHQPARVVFREEPNNTMPQPEVAPDGKSLTFQVPVSRQTISCQAGRIDVSGWCVPIPPGHVDLNDCPPTGSRRANFCSVPMPPGRYRIAVDAPQGVFGDPVPFTVTAPSPTPVSILLVYPSYLVLEGDTITIRGSGFTPTANTVHIGSATVPDLPSPDGKTLTFSAPAPSGASFIPRLRYYNLWVSNPNGRSNPLAFSYR
jgi:hypothetical protein